MPFSVREATTVDTASIIDAYQWLFRSPGGVPPNWDEERAGRSVVDTIESDSSVFYVAISSTEAKIVGICSAYLDVNSIRYGQRCWIEDLAVDPEMRSKGLGRQLIAEVKAWAKGKGATHLELDTGEARLDARRFYEQLEPDQTTVGYGWFLADDSD